MAAHSRKQARASRKMNMQKAQGTEDLREFYITPEYLGRLRERARQWDEKTVQVQASLFQRTIPDYPEVTLILESELHTRSLNQLRRLIRRWPVGRVQELRAKLSAETGREDHLEVIQTELEIRGGACRLFDASGET